MNGKQVLLLVLALSKHFAMEIAWMVYPYSRNRQPTSRVWTVRMIVLMRRSWLTQYTYRHLLANTWPLDTWTDASDWEYDGWPGPGRRGLHAARGAGR